MRARRAGLGRAPGATLTREQADALRTGAPPPGTVITAVVAAVRRHTTATDELLCVCDQQLRQATDSTRVHRPPYTCAWAQPRCSACQMPHVLTPGSFPMNVCARLRGRTPAEAPEQPGDSSEEQHRA